MLELVVGLPAKAKSTIYSAFFIDFVLINTIYRFLLNLNKVVNIGAKVLNFTLTNNVFLSDDTETVVKSN